VDRWEPSLSRHVIAGDRRRSIWAASSIRGSQIYRGGGAVRFGGPYHRRHGRHPCRIGETLDPAVLTTAATVETSDLAVLTTTL
jgi:hypothetical protein